MTVSALEKIKDYYERTVLQKLRLEAPSDTAILEHRMVIPSAHVGWLPLEGGLDGQRLPSIPCIIVGLDSLTMDNEETSVGLRITAVVYDPGHHQVEGDKMGFTPNFEGYQDLLNLLDALAAETRRSGTLAGEYEVDGPIAIKLYEEQPYPYWYGYLQFRVSGVEYPTTAFRDLV